MNLKAIFARSSICPRPTVLTLCISTALGLSAPGVLAQETPTAGNKVSANAELRRYNIPTQSLSEALIQFAQQSGLQVTANSSLVEGRQASPVNGSLSTEQALNQLLAGTGLRYQINGGMVSLVAVGATSVLPPVKVRGESIRFSDLPEEHAGGQVARGGHIGLLGNRDVFDTPFNATNYTAELIENQQARTVADIIQNDPSARLANPSQGSGETIAIRGFNTGGNGAELYDGLPGLAHMRRSTVETLERVEVFKGANTLLTGTTGAVGGVVNLVPKRPGETSLTRLTTAYDSQSRFGVQADLSRRFGSEKQFGTRLNTIYHDGESAIENNEEQLGEIALALEYQGNRLKVEAILDYADQNLDAGNELFLVVSGASIPSAPDVEDAIQQSWEQIETSFSRAILRAEYDLGKEWIVHAAYGATDFEGYWLRTIGLSLNENGDFTPFAQQRSDTRKNHTWTVGMQGRVETGDITHQVSIETLRAESEAGFLNANLPSLNITSNLFNPVFVARPNIDSITRDPSKTSESINSSVAVADTIGFLDERALLTVGVRHQSIEANNFNGNTGMTTSRFDESATTPAIGLVLKPWSFMSVYGNYIEALEQGQSAPIGTANEGETFAPVKTEQVELGVKFDRDGLGLTAGLFQIERPSGIINADNRFAFDGEQRNRGLELNAFGELRPDLRLLGGITYINSELTSTQDGTFDGNNGIGVPELTAVLGLEWDTPILPGLTLTARANHTGSQFVSNENTQEIPSFELYGIGARYEKNIGDQQFTFRMKIDNLLGEDYWTTFVGSGGVLYLGTPRSATLSMSMEL